MDELYVTYLYDEHVDNHDYDDDTDDDRDNKNYITDRAFNARVNSSTYVYISPDFQGLGHLGGKHAKILYSALGGPMGPQMRRKQIDNF